MKILEKLVGIVAPHTCLSCGQEGRLVCEWCLPDVCAALPERCYKCHKLSRDSRVCTSCRKKSRLGSVWVRTEYGGIAKQLVHKLKFERATAAALPIAEMLADTLPYLSESTVITYVPTASSRYRQRGYDQAALIARQLAQIRNVRCIPLLARHGQTRQVGAKRTQRISQLEGAFRPRNAYAIMDAEILLIDDIVTTGATIEAAARVLKDAGAKRVNAAVFAQKQ
jgi:ComF family protein